MHTEIRRAEPLVPERSPFEAEIDREFEKYKSLRTDLTLTKFIQTGGEKLCSEIHKLNYILQWK
jgi:hypothetical protein